MRFYVEKYFANHGCMYGPCHPPRCRSSSWPWGWGTPTPQCKPVRAFTFACLQRVGKSKGRHPIAFFVPLALLECLRVPGRSAAVLTKEKSLATHFAEPAWSRLLISTGLQDIYTDTLATYMSALLYWAFFPVCRKVWKMTSWKVPSAGGLIMQLSTAKAGPRKLYWNPWQNIATDRKKCSVGGYKVKSAIR